MQAAIQPLAWSPPGVRAWMTRRQPGLSTGPWSGFNVGDHVGDDPQVVAQHRRALEAVLGAPALWMQQVHGVDCVPAHERLGARGAHEPLHPVRADAAWTDQAGVGCLVMVADCLPVLLARRDGGVVAAAHAGWRGLAAGVLRQTVATVCEATATEPADLQAWLGPCIGPQHFEVGEDVLAAFGGGARFVPTHPVGDSTPKFLADLPGLALDALAALGVQDVTCSGACTYADAAQYYSHRRDGTPGPTGRMAAAIVRV